MGDHADYRLYTPVHSVLQVSLSLSDLCLGHTTLTLDYSYAPVRSVLQVLLLLRDPLMGDHADYNVLLASTGVSLYAQGLNDLGHTVTVSPFLSV